jgi:hypothetical protein
MDRRNFLKTILGGLVVATVAPSLVKAEPMKFQHYTPPKTDLPVAWDGSCLTMLPESSKIDAVNAHRFPDSWIKPLQIAHSPVVRNIQMHTKKTKTRLSLELLQDKASLGDEIDKWIVDMVMEELKEHNYKFFHSIMLVRVIDTQTFQPMATVLVRGA